MTIPSNDPAVLAEIEAAAKQNLAADDWVTSPPFLQELQALSDDSDESDSPDA